MALEMTDKFLLNLCQLCFEVPKFVPLPSLVIHETSLGGLRNTTDSAMLLKMTAQITTQFVPIVLRDSRICTTSLPLLFMRQVWGGGAKFQSTENKSEISLLSDCFSLFGLH